MSSTVVRRTAAVAALALTVSLGGCQLLLPGAPTTTAPDPETPATEVAAPAGPVAAGDCLADYVPNENGSQDADLTSIVDCSQPHHFLVYATHVIDKTLLTDLGESEAEILERRDDIRLNTGSRNRVYREWSDSVCTFELRDLTGLGDVDVLYGVKGAHLDVRPVGQFYLDITISGEDSWLAGEPYIACALGWTDLDGDLTTRQLPSGTTVADLYSAEFPAETRLCTAYGETNHTNVDCDEAHWMELLVQIDPWNELGEDARLAYDPDTADVAQFDNFCEAFAPLVIGKEDTIDSHFARVVWVFFDDADVPTHVQCGFAPNEAETMDVIGSIAGIGNGSPKFVDATTL